MNTVTSNTNTMNYQRTRSNPRLILLCTVFGLFSLFSLWVMMDIGYFGIWEAGIASSGSVQILLDLVIACVIITSWLIQDAKSLGIKSAPWVIAIVLSGCIGILPYLIFREFKLPREEA